MPPAKKSAEEKLAELELGDRIVSARAMGLSWRKIEVREGVNYETARRIFNKTRERVLKEKMELKVQDHIVEDLIRCETMIAELYQAWCESKGDLERTTHIQGETPKGYVDTTTTANWYSAGNPAFSAEMRHYIVERNRLLDTYNLSSGGRGGSGSKEGGGKLTQIELLQSVYIPGLGHLNNEQMTGFLRDIEASLDDEDDE